MIARGGIRPLSATREFVWKNRAIVLVVVGLEALVWALHRWIPETTVSPLSAGAVGLLATIVGIFLAFRFNEAYARWWEARILWGGVVNQSRSFARQVTTLLTPERVPALASEGEARAVQRELVYRHLAWIHALRLSLRTQPALEEVEPFLSADEHAGLRDARNVTTQLGQRQGRRIAELLEPDTAQHLLLTQLDETLSRLTDLQGGLERIKNTVFPERVVVASRAFVWVVAAMVVFAFVEPSPEIILFELLAVIAIVLAFFGVKQLGDELKDPFESQPNDTPMTALCRTIEIDLRQQLGERDLPEPLQPVDGVLM